MPKDDVDKQKPTEKELLKEIRENYAYWLEEWREIREEAQTDMRYISGDPWDPEDRKFREDNDRPCMAWDELSQYVNQLVNEPKQNKRAVNVSPRGAGASQKTADTRKGLIDEIQYNSKAQMAFTTAFQGAAERSYGFARVGKRYVSGGSGAEAFNQELYIGRIPNPDSVLFDPNYKEMDASDSMGCFVSDMVRKTDFKRKFPKAKITDFTGDLGDDLGEWIREKDVRVAEYWRVTIEHRTAHLLADDSVKFEDELPNDYDQNLSKRTRKIEKRVVTQYITNGIEILDETEIEIPFIPIVPVFGKELFFNDGGGSKRKLLSLVRLARDPYMAYCMYRSQEAEESGMTPRSPVMGYTGQFETDKEVWETINKVPRAYVQVDPVLDATTGQVLPLPQRQPFVPNFESYEVACEAARRAIRSAIGIADLPTAAQRSNEKSGVALKQIESQEDRGSFHFIDNYNLFIEQIGRILDAWIPSTYDTARDVGIREADETRKMVRINDPAGNPDAQGQPEHLDVTTGDHGVTIQIGPDFESQRDEASEFLDTLIANLQSLPIPPQQLAKLLALAIKAKQIGPMGDEMAEIISPAEDAQAQQQAAAQAQGKLQQQGELIAALQAELQTLRLEKAGKVIDNHFKLQLQDMKNQADVFQTQITNDLGALKALLASKQNHTDQEFETFRTFWVENHKAAHDTGLQAQDQAHQQDQAAAAQATAAQAPQVSASSDATQSGQGATP